MRYTVGTFHVDTDAQDPLGPLPKNREYVGVPISFLREVGLSLGYGEENAADLRDQIRNLNAVLDDARQPRPIEQAIAVLAQAWQSAVKPVEPERVAVPDVLLEAQRAGWDSHAVNSSVYVDTDNPWPTETPLWKSWREGWFMADNDEARP